MSPPPPAAAGPALPAGLEEQLPREGKGLLVTRQNLDLGRALRRAAPGVEWTVLSKTDTAGHGAGWLLRTLRGERRDVVVLEDQAAEAARRFDLYRGLLLAARARRRLLITGDPPSVRVVSRGRDGLPLVGSVVLELLAALGAWVWALATLLRLRPRPPRPLPDCRRLAYLRTDFWFGVRAGGSVSHIGGFLGGVRARGAEVSVVTSDALAGLPPGVEQAVVPPPPRPRMLEEFALLGYNRVFRDAAVRALRPRAPDVIVHRHSLFSVAGVLVARALDRPLVLEVNGSEVWVRRRWSRLHLVRLAEALEKRAFACADRITVVSAVLGRHLETLGVDPARIVVNPNGVELDRFDPEADGAAVRTQWDIPADAVVAGFSGTFTRWHGVLFLAELVGRLVREEPRLVFLFLGDGDLRPAVEKLVAEEGAADRCRFTGLIPPDAIPAHLAACDILLSPHLPFEDGTEFIGSPTKLFEYLAAGRPVAATRLGQTGEVIIDGENGLLFEPGDPEGLAQAVLALARDPGLRRRLGARARETAERDFTWAMNAGRALGGSADQVGNP